MSLDRVLGAALRVIGAIAAVAVMREALNHLRSRAGQDSDVAGVESGLPHLVQHPEVVPSPVVENEPPATLDINRAGLSELELLPGIGLATAMAIVETREANGPFRAVDELIKVDGIGPSKLKQLRDHVNVESP